MQIKRIDHVLIAMPAGGEVEARAFYEGLLGIPMVQKPQNLAKRGGCWFEHGEVKVHLGIEADFRPARKAHPAFIVEDLAALSQRLAQAGHPVKSDEALEGYSRVFVDDPFGNRIELMQPDETTGSMSTFGDDLIQAMGEALAHAKGEGSAIVHVPISLTSEMAGFIEQELKSGDYASASDVVRAGLLILQRDRAVEREKLDALRAEIQRGLDDVERGDFSSRSAKEIARSVLRGDE